MGKALTILEVSRKQAYIFASKKLRENAERSQDIAYLTDSAFFRKAAGDLYQESKNLVNTGGGHAVLQFDSRDAAVEFTRRVTMDALRDYPELELFAKTIDYNPAKAPSENMNDLTAALEEKKALRKSSFRRLDFGVELRPDTDEQSRPEGTGRKRNERLKLDRPYPDRLEKLAGKDNFIAVVHIDGNNMGARVSGLYAGHPDWEDCRTALQKFSGSIQRDFEDTFREMAEEVSRRFPSLDVLPLRPIILAGDDVCFVTAGSIGLECARLFIEKLTGKTNRADGKPYAACAGVAIVRLKYPFHRAYSLAEQLCDNAKLFSAELDQDRQVSAMDWHIEFGQLKDSLSELREDYQTEDGCRLELRPVTVVVPKGKTLPPPERTYRFFRDMCMSMRGEYGHIARSKLKELRTALKQGRAESQFFLRDREIGDLLYKPLEVGYSREQWREKIENKGAFRPFTEGGKAVTRSLFFDALELIDRFTPFEEVGV